MQSLLIVLALTCSAFGENQPRFIAFSLREACTRAEQGHVDRELNSLGKITRIAGIVYDRQRRDVILVGLACADLPPARFDDLVVALRARLMYDEFPLVSIDPVESTERTRLQKVRFLGHLEDTPFGKDFLACDILLKLYSLQLLETIPSVEPYTRLLERDIKRRVESGGVKVAGIHWHSGEQGAGLARSQHGKHVRNAESYQARFWFYVRLPYNAACKPGESHPEVFCIRELSLCLRSQDLHQQGSGSGHHARQRFSEAWTAHFDELYKKHPVLRRLKVLYDLVAVADAIRSIDRNIEQQTYLRFALEKFPVARVPTPRDYKLENAYGVVDRSDGLKHLVRISGGIQFVPDVEDAVEDLNYGVLMELRTIVLGTRPAENALTWRLPLEGWQMPNARDRTLPKAADRAWLAQAAAQNQAGAGCSITCQSVILDPRQPGAGGGGMERFSGFGSLPPSPSPLKGVSMRMEVTDGAFSRPSDGSLKSLRDSILKGRPSAGAFSWPAGENDRTINKPKEDHP